MAANPPQVFSNVTQDQFTALAQRAAAAGIALNGNSGTASSFGAEVAWDYSPETGKLSIQCLSAPFFMSADKIDARIKSLVEETVKSSSE